MHLLTIRALDCLQNNVLPRNQAVNSRSYRQTPQDSSFPDPISEYESLSVARTEANTFGATPYTAHHARAFDLEDNAGEHFGARFSEPLPPVLSSNTARSIEASEITPQCAQFSV